MNMQPNTFACHPCLVLAMVDTHKVGSRLAELAGFGLGDGAASVARTRKGFALEQPRCRHSIQRTDVVNRLRRDRANTEMCAMLYLGGGHRDYVACIFWPRSVSPMQCK